MLKNVFLDLDDTIFDFSKSERIALSRVITENGVAPTEEMLKRYSVINQQCWQRMEKGELNINEVLVVRFEIFFREFGIAADAEASMRKYEGYLENMYFYIYGAKKMLIDLSKRYRLYLITNGASAVQRGRLKLSGIAKYFQGIFISQEIGVNKPSREYFDYCFSAISDFKKEESIVVGDSLSSDILGGKLQEIRTVWFNRFKKAQPIDIVPDFTVSSIKELHSLLVEMNA